MYRGFNLKKINFEDAIILHQIGLSLHEGHKQEVMKVLKNFALNEGVLNGSKMQSDWFPQINSHIFISHSHDDRDTVITLAGWLYKYLGVTAFIDSCVWGNANDLLKLLDDKFCLNDGGKTYNYTKRNYSTSHVHMMLSTALSKMIDKTECLFFYNTPQSISSSSIISKTESPWIYSEITMTQLLRHNMPERIKRKIADADTKTFSKGGVTERLKIEYEVDLTHLVDIDADTLNSWRECGAKGEKALDKLYELMPIKKPEIIQE